MLLEKLTSREVTKGGRCKLICTATKLKLYNAFILPHFQFCSTVWHFVVLEFVLN